MMRSIRRPALLVIDMQNDFVRSGGALEVPAARPTIPVIGQLLERFRVASLPVVYTRYIADPLYFPLAGKLSWIERLKPPIEAFVANATRHYPDIGEERDVIGIIDELLPCPGEVVVDKIYYSAFHRTDLADLLARQSADGVVVVGTVTEMCVEDTARHAVHFGYPTVIISDAVSSGDPKTHAATLSVFARNYGWVLSADDVLALPALAIP